MSPCNQAAINKKHHKLDDSQATVVVLEAEVQDLGSLMVGF